MNNAPKVTLEAVLNFEMARARRESEHEELECPACPGCTQPMMVEEGAWWCCECEIVGEEA